MTLITVDSLITLRLSMKYKESQADMYAEPNFSYQKVYDSIVSRIWEKKETLFGSVEEGYRIENW